MQKFKDSKFLGFKNEGALMMPAVLLWLVWRQLDVR